MVDQTAVAAAQEVLRPLTAAAVASFALQILKKAKWFTMLSSDSSKTIKFVFAALAALLSHLGISYAYDPQLHTLLISGLSVATIAAAAWAWLQQFVIQEGWYQVALNKTDVSAKKEDSVAGAIGNVGQK